MTVARRERVEEVFQAAADLKGAERVAYLADACGRDQELRAEVESLLANFDEGTKGVLKSPLSAGAGMCEIGVPERLGRYRVLRLIGEGGMGTVYEAEQDHPHRKVALKVIRSGFVSGAMLRRFEHEAHVLGQLRHLGIAQIYEAGSIALPGGGTPVPYFAMELVRGRSLDRYIADKSPPLRDRLELMAKICDAVHHAHQKGVIHRDLKPANVLIEEEGEAQPKILDFGIARVTDADVGRVTMDTGAGQILGTLPYMSPEQVLGDPGAIDIRSDVYSLGVTLYEVLGGELPYDLGKASLPEAVRIIREQEPRPLTAINARLGGDLSTIARKALEKDKDRRYASAAELGADIRRFLRDEPISARPPTTMYQLRKFARRNKVLVGGVAATALALVLGVVAATSFAIRSARHADRAERTAYRAGIAAAGAALQTHNAALAQASLAQTPERLRGWEWKYLSRAADRSIACVPTDRVLTQLVVSPDGTTLYGRAADCIEVRSATSGDLLRRVTLARPSVSMSLSRDGRTMLLLRNDRALALHETEDFREHWVVPGVFSISASAFSPSGEIAVSMADGFRFDFLSPRDGSVLRSLPTPATPASGPAFGADEAVFMSYAYGLMHCCRAKDGGVVWQERAAAPWIDRAGARVSTLAVGSHLFDLKTGRALMTVTPVTSGIDQVIVSPDGETLAVAERSGPAVLWSVRTGQPHTTLYGHRQPIWGMAFSPDSRKVYTSCSDGTLRIWDCDAPAAPAAIPTGEEASHAALVVPQGGMIVSAGWGSLRGWSVEEGAPRYNTYVGGPPHGAVLALSPDGSRIALAGWRARITTFDVASGKIIRSFSDPLKKSRVLVWLRLASGDRLLAAEPSGEARLVNPEDGSTGEEIDLPSLTSATRGLSPAQMLLGGADGRLWTWDVERGSPTASPDPHETSIVAITISLDGSRCATTDARGLVMLRGRDRARRGAPVAIDVKVSSMAFSGDGTRLAAGCADGSIRLIDTEGHDQVATLPGSSFAVEALRFVENDRALVACSYIRHLVFDTGLPSQESRSHRLAGEASAYLAQMVTNNRLRLMDEHVAGLEADADLTPEFRGHVARAATTRGDPPGPLNSHAWGVGRAVNSTIEDVEASVRVAERLCEAWPKEHHIINTLGMSYYRAGRHADAVRTLKRSYEISVAADGFVSPIDAAGIGMASARLGDAVAAREWTARARALFDAAKFLSADEEAENLAFIREAEEMVGKGK